MKEYTILTVNPGSTSTKIGIYKDGRITFDINVETPAEAISDCETFEGQLPAREAAIMKILEENHIDLSEIDAVSGRGVGILPCEGGTYLRRGLFNMSVAIYLAISYNPTERNYYIRWLKCIGMTFQKSKI